ncbi:hypothetical protein [Bradyrhizobium sp. USDA 3458]|uniref:hypothetical protein n=1 Tax=Bradyrhizobium sp. USDA 3458 TaxID=2591461 RepID=UPI0011426763|nr:hypothetical protein [Bradyrhizobium sp. USDA 3458]
MRGSKAAGKKEVPLSPIAIEVVRRTGATRWPVVRSTALDLEPIEIIDSCFSDHGFTAGKASLTTNRN